MRHCSLFVFFFGYFPKNRSRSTNLVSLARSSHKKMHMHNIKQYLLLFEKIWLIFKFCKSRSKVTRLQILVSMERSFHKEMRNTHTNYESSTSYGEKDNITKVKFFCHIKISPSLLAHCCHTTKSSSSTNNKYLYCIVQRL